jgi:uncharacterized tellurite resistance protein B-like protein
VLRAIKRFLAAAQADTPAVPAHERRQLQLAVAVLVHEARRADYAERDDESATAERALAEIFGLRPPEAAALLNEGRERAQQLTSFYAPLTVIKREFSLEDRIRLVEHLWRITFADGQLNPGVTTVLLGADPLLADDPAPARPLGADEGAELLRRAANRLRAERGEALAHFRQAQHLADVGL